MLDSWSFADWAFPTYVLTTGTFIMLLMAVAPRVCWLRPSAAAGSGTD